MARTISVEAAIRELMDKNKELSQEIEALQNRLTHTQEVVKADPMRGMVDKIASRVKELAQRERDVQYVDNSKTETVIKNVENPFDSSALEARIDALAETIPEVPEQDYQLDMRQGKYRLRKPDGGWSPWYQISNGGGGLSQQQVQSLIEEALLNFEDTDTRTNVSHDGTQVLSLTTDINFTGNGVNVSDDGDGSVTVTVTDTDTVYDDTAIQTAVNENTTNISNNADAIAALGSANTGDQNLYDTVSGNTGNLSPEGTSTELAIVGDGTDIVTQAQHDGAGGQPDTILIDASNLRSDIDQNASDISDLGDGITIIEGRLDDLEDGSGVFLQTVRTEASGNQTLNSGVLTTLDFDTATFNNATSTFTVGSNGVITVNETGLYMITAGVVIQASALSAVSETDLYIRHNGTDLIAGSSNDSTLGVGTERALSCATTYSLQAGDTIEAVAGVVSALGLGNILALLLPALFGSNAEPINHLSITRIA